MPAHYGDMIEAEFRSSPGLGESVLGITMVSGKFTSSLLAWEVKEWYTTTDHEYSPDEDALCR